MSYLSTSSSEYSEYHDDEEIDKIFKDAKDSIKISNIQYKKCDHKYTEKNKSEMIELCLTCGIEIQLQNNEPEWKNYSEGKKSLERCQYKKADDKSIYKILETCTGIDSIKNDINKEYLTVFNEEIHRGNTLKGILYAVILEKCKEKNILKLPTELYNELSINKKTATGGIKKYTQKKGKLLKYNTEDMIISMFKKVYFHKDFKEKNYSKYEQQLKILYNTKIKNKNSVINSSSPLSVSCALILYYLNSIDKKITIAELNKIISLSPVTVSNLVKVIKEMCE